jgi:uncharacterized protein (TIGR03437 family)
MMTPMKSILRTSAIFVSLLGAQAFGQSLTWDTSGNGSLSGTYYFREVLYTFGSTGGGQYAVFGNITFSGTGTYTITTASAVEVGAGSGTVGPLTGSYSINSAGFGFMTDPLLPLLGSTTGATIRGMVSHGVFVGTDTDSGFSNLFVAALEPSPAPTAATFNGTYSMTYFNFSALDGDPYDAQFTLSSSGGGTFSTSNLQGIYGTATGPATVTQSVGNEKYTASSGAIVLNFPTLSTSTPLLGGQEYMYFSSDGNFVFGGSPAQADFFVGVNTSASSSPLLNSPLFYNAGLYSYIDTGGFEDFDTYYGSFSLSQGNVIQHIRSLSVGNGGAIDSVDTDSAPTTSGATYSDGLYNYTIGGGGLYRIGYGQAPLLGIDIAVAAPSFSGSGVYLNPTGVVNAASYAPFTTGVAPGELLVLTGSGLAPNTSIGSGDIATTAQWPTKLNGVQVIIDGIPAPLYYVSATQIAAIVPFEASLYAIATIQVNNNGALSKTLTEFVSPGVAGIFTNPADGIGYAAAEHLSGALVTEANPAQPGEYISVFLTGLGSVFPPNLDGAPGSSTTLNNTVNTITANIDGLTSGTQTAASVVYAGLAPGYAGLYQVNIQIPTGVAAGDNFLEIDVTNASGVTVSTAEEALIPIGSGTATSSAVPRKEDSGKGQNNGKHWVPRPTQKPVITQPVQQ